MNLGRALSKYASADTPAAPRAAETCELCAAPIDQSHAHVVDLHAQRLCCACRACALLFSERGAALGRYRTVPRRVLRDPAFELDEATWAALEIPVRLSFMFYHSAGACWLALCPSPAGITETEPSPAGLSRLVERSALARSAEPDVEALLVYGPPGAPLRMLLVPIDSCYELAALVRQSWTGPSGGDTRQEVAAFMQRLSDRSRVLDAAAAGAP